MSDWKKQERTAIEAVVRQFSATWKKAGRPRDACILIDGKQVGVDIATLNTPAKGRSNPAAPRLRFDKVATRLIERLQSGLAKAVPDGTTVLLTITAPILLPSKTAATLQVKIQTLLASKSPRRDEPARHEKVTVHGNRVHIRLLQNGPARAPKIIGFVHDPDTDPLQLLNMTQGLLELLTAHAARRRPRIAGDRWLVVIAPEGVSSLKPYPYIYAQLRIASGFKKIFMVFSDGRAALLTG